MARGKIHARVNSCVNDVFKACTTAIWDNTIQTKNDGGIWKQHNLIRELLVVVITDKMNDTVQTILKISII
jgi:hypothetical protein